uniref:Chemokine interleukin-8-like domain-containing protein n=1 Tax=Amphilophus citrinellus TaxID=61819 RepID=A0A3Q0S0K3_AMPCI
MVSIFLLLSQCRLMPVACVCIVLENKPKGWLLLKRLQTLKSSEMCPKILHKLKMNGHKYCPDLNPSAKLEKVLLFALYSSQFH